MLPKFLIADNSQEATDLVYVVHTESPRCIIQCGLDGFYDNQRIYWIDEEPLSQDYFNQQPNPSLATILSRITAPM